MHKKWNISAFFLASYDWFQDGINVYIRSLEVAIQDIQDTPPQFTSGLTAVVNEGERVVSATHLYIMWYDHVIQY